MVTGLTEDSEESSDSYCKAINSLIFIITQIQFGVLLDSWERLQRDAKLAQL